jgi:hypothetical protein
MAEASINMLHQQLVAARSLLFFVSIPRKKKVSGFDVNSFLPGVV